MLARRVLRMRDELGIDVSLPDLASHHLEVNLGGHLNKQTEAGLLTILSLEEDRYAEMLRKGTNVIQTQLKSVPKSSEAIPDEHLFTMNDSHGLAPDMAITLARNAGWSHVARELDFLQKWPSAMPGLAKEAASVASASTSTLDVASLPATTTCTTMPSTSRSSMQRSWRAWRPTARVPKVHPTPSSLIQRSLSRRRRARGRPWDIVQGDLNR